MCPSRRGYTTGIDVSKPWTSRCLVLEMGVGKPTSKGGSKVSRPRRRKTPSNKYRDVTAPPGRHDYARIFPSADGPENMDLCIAKYAAKVRIICEMAKEIGRENEKRATKRLRAAPKRGATEPVAAFGWPFRRPPAETAIRWILVFTAPDAASRGRPSGRGWQSGNPPRHRAPRPPDCPGPPAGRRRAAPARWRAGEWPR